MIQEQKNDDSHDDDDDDETTVSKSCEKMWEINLGAPGTCYYPPSNILIHEEENNVSLKQLISHIYISTLTKTRIKRITFS